MISCKMAYVFAQFKKFILYAKWNSGGDKYYKVTGKDNLKFNKHFSQAKMGSL